MGIFSRKTNVEIKNRFISFDISELPQSIQTTAYLVILEHIMNRLKRNKTLGKHTWIFIDEFHILLANQYSAEYIARIYKTGRKENAIPTIITQNIADVIKNEDGCKILSNSEFAMILKQKPLDLPPICKIFDISDEESRYVTDSPSGQGIIVYGDDKVIFRNQGSKDSYIYELNQTSNMQVSRGQTMANDNSKDIANSLNKYTDYAHKGTNLVLDSAENINKWYEEQLNKIAESDVDTSRIETGVDNK